MKKLLSATLVGVLFLTACSGEEEKESSEETTEEATEETSEETTEEESAEKESTQEEDTEEESTGEKESSEENTESSASKETDVDAAGKSEETEESSSEDLTEAEIDEDSLDSAYDIDENKVNMIEKATETDQSIEDVLKDPSEITSYREDTSIIIEVTEGEELVNKSFQGIVAEVDKSDGLEVASDYFDENFEIIQPHGYGNSDTEELYMYTESGWTDYSSEYGAEDLVYGTYSNVHEIINQMPDSMKVMEEGDYDLLYYTGNDDIVHQLYQDTFQVEFTGADMEKLEMGFVAFVNKKSGDLESVNLIATAPGLQNPEQTLTIEIILNYQEYGAFDGDKEIKKPDTGENTGSTEESGE